MLGTPGPRGLPGMDGPEGKRGRKGTYYKHQHSTVKYHSVNYVVKLMDV